MGTCYAHTLQSFSCFVFVCVECHHNSKIILINTGYIMGNYLILQKNPVNISTMKIGYCPIPLLFQIGNNYPNDNLDYTPPNHIAVNLFGTIAKAANKSAHEIKLLVLSTTSKPDAFIIPSKLSTYLMTWSSIKISTTSPSKNCRSSSYCCSCSYSFNYYKNECCNQCSSVSCNDSHFVGHHEFLSVTKQPDDCLQFLSPYTNQCSMSKSESSGPDPSTWHKSGQQC